MDENNNDPIYGPYEYNWSPQDPNPPQPEPEPEPVAPIPEPPQPPQPQYPYQYNAPPYAAPTYYPPPQQAVPQPPKKKRGRAVFAVLAVIIVLAGAIIGVGIYRGVNNPAEAGSPKTSSSQNKADKDDSKLEIAETPSGGILSTDGALTSEQVYEKVRNTNVAVQLYSGRSAENVVGEGSGIILHEDSTKTYTYILTCAHVINGDERISVELEDGTTFEATVIGYDNRTDIGLLRIKKTGLTAAEFGDSDQLKVGAPVYAIGNPGGVEFKGSFTPGMVSAIDRPIQSTYKMQTIQHTAPISPGNSGGALVNSYGQVIGVNSQKIVDNEYENMGFAIPSKVVQNVVNNLISKGYVPDRPKLGIQYIAASQTQKGYYVIHIKDLPSGSLIIAKIDEDSAISGTDVRINDIITHVNGKPLNKADVLLSLIEKGKVGDTLKLTIARVGENYSITTFEVNAKLVEDKGNSSTEEETTQPWYYDDFESIW